MPDYDISRLTLADYDCKWKKAGGAYVVLGAVDKVTPDIQIIKKPKKVGSVGDVELGHWIIGLQVQITTEMREIDRTQFETLMPWFTSGNIPLVPTTWHKDTYDYAGPLVLHPNHLGVGTTTENIILYKAVPMIRPADRDGVNDEKLIITWSAYPDRTQLNTGGALLLDYGRIGGTDP